MKIAVTPNYTFIPASNSIVTGITNFSVKRLYAIINLTTDTIIMATATSGKGTSSYNSATDTLVLDYNTSAMNATDILQFFYDDESVEVNNAQIVAVLDRMLAMWSNLRDITAGLRVSIQNIPQVTINSGTLTQVTTVPTVASVTNQVQMGGYQAAQQVPALQNMAAVQSNINNIQIT
jgi:hypothetical protein